MIGSVLANRYRIMSLLGAGGMGEVFLARDQTLERDVAIKMLPASLSHDAAARERLRREALAAAGLDHPFICKVFEIGEADGRVFIVMEYVAGQMLAEVLGTGPMAPGDLITLALELTDALEAAHGRRIVHRDLKPGNIMLTAQRHVKVMDFGLAKVLVEAADETRAGVAALTGHGVRLGTPAYMSPEQVSGDAVDHRSDLFSLGVVLIEAATGVHPFTRSTSAGTMTAVLHDAPFAHATTAVGDMPTSLRAVLLRLLAKGPDSRYQSAAEVRSDLQSLQTPRAGAGHARATASTGVEPGLPKHRWAIVGRQAERAELTRHLDAALAGQGGVVLVGGEPGIGKTRLTEELLAEARQRGASAVVGHCYEMQGAPPYVPFVEMIEYTARVVPPSALRRLLGDDAPEVTRLMPELRRIFPEIPAPIELPAEQQRWYFFNAYRSFVDRASRIAPIVAVFEDLHWADEPTLQLLLHIAQTASSMPLLIVGTYRDVELDVTRPFARVLETLLRQRLASRLTLRRLSAPDVEALLTAISGRPAPVALTSAVFRETEGNPFFVEEVFQHLNEEGRLFMSDGQWKPDLRVQTLDVPEGVRLVIGRRLERLGEGARRILPTAAVLGRVFSLGLLEDLEAGAGGAGADAVIDAIEEAERAHLVTPHSGGRDTQYTFAHELIRQTLADALSMPRRQRLHARIAAAIEQRYAAHLDKHVSALAHHLYQAGALVDAEKTTDCLARAAGLARDAAGHEEALGYLDNALTLWEGERTARVADLLDRRSAALASLGRTADAVAANREAAAIWRERGDDERYGASVEALVGKLTWLLDYGGAFAEIDRALAHLQHAPGLTARVALSYRRVALLWVSGAVVDANESLAEADALRAAHTDPRLDALAMAVAAGVAEATWRLDRGRLSRKGIEAFSAIGRPWDAIDGAFILLFSEIERGAFDEVDALITDLGAQAARIGHRSVEYVIGMARVTLSELCGDLARAEREARASREFGRTHGIPWAVLSDAVVGHLLFLQGKVDEGLELLGRAAAAEPRSVYAYRVRANFFRWLAYVRPEKAREYLASTEIPLPSPDVLSPFGSWLSLLTVAPGLHVLGDRAALARLMPVTERLENADTRVMEEAAAGAVAGLTAAAAGAWDVAEAHFRATLAHCDATPVPVHQGTTREWYADMLTARGEGDDHARAATLYDEAAANYERLGLGTYARHLAGKRSERQRL